MDEKQRIAAAQAGDAGALDALLRELQPKLFRFSMRMCGRIEDAEDALQETLMAVVHGLPRFRGEASLSTWGYTIARRVCARARQRQQPTEPAEDERLAGDHDPAAEAGRARQWAQIRAAILALDPGQREVFVLRDIEGLSAREVGEVLELGVAAVKSRLHRARASVRQLLAKDLAEPEPGCPNIRAVFSSHLEGDLSAGQCALMQDHVHQCSSCAAECDALKEVLAVCSEAPSEVPPEVQQRVQVALARALGRAMV